MEKEIKDLVNNYELGFISPQEFISRYMEMLTALGAEQELYNVWSELDAPLANHLLGILKGSCKRISDFNKEKQQ